MTTNPTPYVHALNLGERAALLAGLGNVENASTSSEARRGLTRWAEQSPFDRGDWLDRRLANDGLDRCALLALLDGNGLRRLDHALHASEVEQLGWWRVLRALMKLLSSAPADTPFGDSTLDWGNGAAAAFLDAFEPLIQPVVE